MSRSSSRIQIQTILASSAIQIPSTGDLAGMIGMPAGFQDDQNSRLTKIHHQVTAPKKSGVSIIQTDDKTNKPYIESLSWIKIFEAIKKNQAPKAIKLLDEIKDKDYLAKALFQIHTEANIIRLIKACCQAAASNKSIKPNSDITITAQSFEIVIKDILTTLNHRHKLHFSCGLPSHHASRKTAAGFCLLNKVAILQAIDHLVYGDCFDSVILGLDVNRDDGLCNILSRQPFAFTHLDVFDSRVYPWDEAKTIAKSLGPCDKEKKGYYQWGLETQRYLAIDLLNNPRQIGDEIHPALSLSLKKLEQCLLSAKRNQRSVMLYLPLGWDSHEKELAGCSSIPGGTRARMTYRFNQKDMLYFYQELKTLLNQYQSTVIATYIHLEGGYTDEVIQQELSNMTEVLLSSNKHEKRKHQSSEFFSDKSSDASKDKASHQAKKARKF